MTRISPPTIDPTQGVQGNPAGTEGGYYGNEHDSHTHDKPDRVKVGADDGGMPIDPIPASHAGGENIPDDAGRRGWVDQRTGAVHGSGSSAGGGTDGDDIDRD